MEPKREQARKGRRIGMSLMALAGAASVVLAIYNGFHHQWVALTSNLVLAFGMACSLLAQQQLGKHRRQ